jgi:hypothetical protein
VFLLIIDVTKPRMTLQYDFTDSREVVKPESANRELNQAGRLNPCFFNTETQSHGEATSTKTARQHKLTSLVWVRLSVSPWSEHA